MRRIVAAKLLLLMSPRFLLIQMWRPEKKVTLHAAEKTLTLPIWS
jgi:hypothetical protein